MMKNEIKNRKTVKYAVKILFAVLCITFLANGHGIDASAAKLKALKVTYKGKTVTLETLKSKTGCISPAKAAKYWGAGKKKGNDYIWKAGKSYVKISQGSLISEGGDYRYGVVISIVNKKMSLLGIKVGMKEERVVKLMTKKYGKKSITTQESEDGSHYIHINFGGQGASARMILTVYIEDGVVSKIYGFHS